MISAERVISYVIRESFIIKRSFKRSNKEVIRIDTAFRSL